MHHVNCSDSADDSRTHHHCYSDQTCSLTASAAICTVRWQHRYGSVKESARVCFTVCRGRHHYHRHFSNHSYFRMCINKRKRASSNYSHPSASLYSALELVKVISMLRLTSSSLMTLFSIYERILSAWQTGLNDPRLRREGWALDLPLFEKQTTFNLPIICRL